VLPAVFLAGIDAVAVGGGSFGRFGPALAGWMVSSPLLTKPSLPAPVWAVPVVLLMVIVSPRALPDYAAYFYPDYRSAYAYFTDMPGQTIYSYGLRPYFLLGRETQHRVIYDLNPPRALVLDPGGLVRVLLDCMSPSYLVFSDHGIGNGYFGELLVNGVEVVSQNEHLVILRNNAARSGRSPKARCFGSYFMTG
jgi:hypothetical protein